MSEQLHIVRSLFENGATIDKANKDGKTPIFYVTSGNQVMLNYRQQAYDEKYVSHKKLFNLIKHTPTYELRQKKDEILSLIAHNIDIFNWQYEQTTIFKLLIALPDYTFDLLIEILIKVLPIPDINLSNLKFTHKFIRSILFIKANHSNTDFTLSEFKLCNFSSVNLSGSNLSLREINCQGLTLTDALPPLNTTNLVLEGAKFYKATFDIKTLLTLIAFAENKQISIQDNKIVPTRSISSGVYSFPQFAIAEIDKLAKYTV